MRKALVTFFLGLILGFVLMGLLILFLSSKKYIDNERLYGFPEMVYYIMQSLSVLGTFLALLVAIFGTEIKSLFFSPKCEVYIVDDGFTEDLGQTSSSSSPSAQLYNCTLALKNTGSKELENLSLVIKDVHFVGESGKTKRIKKWKPRFSGLDQKTRILLLERQSVENLLLHVFYQKHLRVLLTILVNRLSDFQLQG